ncbi:13982_t:CDS:2 [Funneliformis geosporum]|uniref:13982_t:CDS:1 n=1 Tax=Funneliformis geosporum TaxID=1117311 RepID=A0A9W4WQP2_9GLOM|nr:13982_t:CDS:2 [Funneliformis geosporum]
MTRSNDKERIKYLDYSEIQTIIEIGKGEKSVIRNTDWTKHNNRVALKNPFGNDVTVLEYANEGNLKNYLKKQFITLSWSKKIEMALDITRGLMYLHSENIIHRNLHAENILVNDGKLKIANTYLFGVSEPKLWYTDPKYLFDPVNCELDMKSDIYSLSILLWELSSGCSPYSKLQLSDDKLRQQILNGLREVTVANTPIKYQQLYQICWEENPGQRPIVENVFETLNQLKLDIDKENELSTDEEIIQKLKLNHGLFLDDYNIKPSKKTIYNNGELDINLYDGQPIIYTNINEPNNNFDINLKPSFQQNDICINFPFAEITFKGNFVDTFLNSKDEGGKLNDNYGHYFSEKVLVGGQLFIKNFNTSTKIQIDLLKMHLSWAYNLAKGERNQLYDFINLQLVPKLETSDGKELTTTEKLINWMKNMYQENMIDIISYINPIPVSQLKMNENYLASDLNEKVIKVCNYKERLNLEDWIKDSIYVDLPRWVYDFNLLQGLIINKDLEIEIAKKVAIDLIKYPYLELKNSFDLKLKKPTNQFEKFLLSNKVSSIKKENLHIFNNIFITNNDELELNEDNVVDFHFINYKQYEILLPWDNIIFSKELTQDIKKGIKDMKPYKALQDIFNEYGYLFPQKIVLGKSFKFTSTKFSPKEFAKIPIESVKSHLKPFDLLTRKGDKIDDLSNFIQGNKDLEIIEYDDVLTLYDILQVELQKQIDVIFEDDYKIIMVGIDDLEDLNDNNIEHYKRIIINPSLNDQNYEVFGSIISNEPKLTKSKEFSVKFKLNDFKGFTAIIKNIETQNSKITKISEFHILWMIIGKPSKLPELSVFSPKNREFQIIFINESILLQPDKYYYEIKTPFQLSEGYMISINTYHPPINDEPANIIEFVKWSCNSIIFRSYSILKALSMNENEVGIEYEDNLLIENFSIELHICIIFPDSKKLKIDKKYSLDFLDLVGNIFTNENFIEYSLNTEKRIVTMDNIDLNVIVEKIISYLLNDKDFTFDESKRIQVILENHITNDGLTITDILNWLLNNQNKLNNIFLLGYFYCFIIKTKEVYNNAFDLFHDAASQSHDLAKYYTGFCYLNGIGTKKNSVEAFNYFKQLSEVVRENYTDGLVILGYCYINGIGTEIDEKMAFEFYRRAAKKENVYAQNKLGLLYKSGIGTNKDLNDAIYWIKKSAANKSMDGKNILNTLYIYSKNMEIDVVDSFSQESELQ